MSDKTKFPHDPPAWAWTDKTGAWLWIGKPTPELADKLISWFFVAVWCVALMLMAAVCGPIALWLRFGG